MDFDTYKRVLGGYGNSIENAYENSTINNINDKFMTYPMTATIPINGVNTDVRIIMEDDKNPDVRTLLFRPNTIKTRGNIVTGYDNSNWMIVEYFPNVLMPKAIINRCNAVLKWKDSSNVLHQYDCVAKLLSDREEQLKADKMFDVPYEKFIILVQFNSDTQNILLKQRFLFNQTAYWVVGKDDVSKVINGVGYMNLILQQVEASPADDFVNGIPDNGTIYGGASSGASTNEGGGLW